MTEKHFFRVILNGQFKDFETVEDAAEYIKKKWNEKVTFCNIKKMGKEGGCVKFNIQR
jgi:hypothetical protein